jgi:AcrR family transcriptional regulator
MSLFARLGYEDVHVRDVSAELGVSKASVFQHFGSKERLFLASYERAVSLLPAYDDAPGPVLSDGFFATIGYWLERTEHLVREDWVPYRVSLIGNHATDLGLQREINRWLTDDDPYGTRRFVRRAIASGELRDDIAENMIVSLVDWLMERFQDALVTEELDPGLFARRNRGEREARIHDFVTLMRDALSAR